MKVPAPADALRVARALLGISQRTAAERAHIVQKSVSAAENGKNIQLDTNLALVAYYQSEGIEFLGEAKVGESIRRSGARWASPEVSSPFEMNNPRHRAELTDVSFRAARALLGKEQMEVADLTGLSVDAVKGLERGDRARRSYDVLRTWYEDQGVEFTGWGDVATRKFFGVGVRWRS